jgi:hypothetical protein
MQVVDFTTSEFSKITILGLFRQSRKESSEKGIANFTYYSSTGIGFRDRRFPIEIIRSNRYMKIKFIHFGQSENRVSIPAIDTSPMS